MKVSQTTEVEELYRIKDEIKSMRGREFTFWYLWVDSRAHECYSRSSQHLLTLRCSFHAAGEPLWFLHHPNTAATADQNSITALV